MLELCNVSYNYNRKLPPAVVDVSLTIDPGEFVAVAGRNGSGKTTLTKLLMALLKPTAGEIKFNHTGTNRLGPADMARHIGYVFQNPDRQIFRDTVFAEVAFGPEMLGFTEQEVTAATNDALELAGVSNLSTAYPRTLTKSQKQRVAMASALAMRPQYLILDEPTSGQDAQTREYFMQLLAELNTAGKTIILVTHDMEALARYARRVIVMDRGQVAYDGTVTECFTNPQQLAAAGLRDPAAVQISRALTPAKINLTTQIPDLAEQILMQRGMKHV